MTLPQFHLSMEEVEAILGENEGRRAPRDEIRLGPGGNHKGHWRDVKMVGADTRERLQAALDDLAATDGLPPLVLSKCAGVYVARQFSDTGVPHPLVQIVMSGRREIAVMYDGEVWE